ncbi:MAG: hypothetical protein MK212_18315 [Saprospiraceae bacterium]|nr:hypothetical protein [Saprospiraceae bacterium]
MLPKKIRITLILLLSIGGIVSLFFDPYLAIAFWGLSFLMILSHFRHNNMIRVLRALGKGQSNRAEELLSEISRPDLLAKRYRAYYHFAVGLLASQRKEQHVVKTAFAKALELNLKGEQEQAIAYLSLARTAYLEKDIDNAKFYLDKTKEKQTQDLFLKQRIDELETALAKT